MRIAFFQAMMLVGAAHAQQANVLTEDIEDNELAQFDAEQNYILPALSEINLELADATNDEDVMAALAELGDGVSDEPNDLLQVEKKKK